MSGPDAASYATLVDALAAEAAALDTVVADLDEAGWSMPTPAEGWDVRTSIAHLAAAEMWATLALTDPDGFRAELGRLASDGDRLADEARSGLLFRRSAPGIDTLTWWRETRTRAVELLRRRDPSDRLPWFGPDMSAMSFATARLMETWAHGRDVFDALGAKQPATDRLRHVAEIGVRTRGWAYAARGRAAPDTPVRVELAGPSGEEWAWGDPGAADVVRGPALDFCLVVTQRRHPDDTDLATVGAGAAEWIGIAQAFAGGPTAQRPRN
jgi:uncharacterized protein (TIGR03084 family)